MSADAPATGLAARLLRRAEGQVGALRPQLAATYSAAPEAAAPMIEWTEEIAAGPAPSPPKPRAPIPAAAPWVPADAEPLRLMPAPQGDLTLPPKVPATMAEAAPPATTMGEAQPHVPAPSAGQQPDASPLAVAPLAPHEAPRARRGERAADSLSAAVLQLLGPTVTTAPLAKAATSPGQPDPAAPARPGQAVPHATDTLPGAASVPAGNAPPLHIHIGELVIAPEPRAPQRDAAPAASWVPPLSLADYRASRERARP